MDLILLQYFQTVAKENHLTRASQKLNIAQPALSAAIARLEKDLGVQLFNRIGRQIMLNEYGKLLLEHVDDILNNWDIAQNKIDQRQRETKNHIKFAITGMVFPQKLILDFKKEYPDISVKQNIIKTDQIIPSLAKDKFDFVISTIPVDEETIECHIVLEESLFIAVNKDHPFASYKSITIAETNGQPFVNLPAGCAFREFTDTLCRQAGFEQNVVFESYPAHFSDMVGQNIGILFATESSIRDGSFHPSIVFLPIVNPPCRRAIYVLWEKSRVFSKTMHSFYDFYLQYNSKTT
ncbi:MAG: LysR family transcriptional regulator [Negativicutes bacterium]|nr:LysR family transcriptional regulator [Negativicutes bacterium]